MRNLTFIEFEIPFEGNKEDFTVNSKNSLSDSDIVIFNPDLSNANYSTYDYDGSRSLQYEGKKLYNKESSVKLIEHSDHWRQEITAFLKGGKNVFVILSEVDDFFIYTGEKTLTGVGRNQQTTLHVKSFSNYNFIPSKLKVKSAKGKLIVPVDPLVKTFYNELKEDLTYETYLKDSESIKVLFSTKSNDKILGGAINIENGYLVLLPKISFDSTKYSTIRKKDNEEYWNQKGIQKCNRFIQLILEIDNSLRKTETKTPKPEWLTQSKFGLSGINSLQKKILDIEAKIEKSKKDIEDINNQVNELDNYRDLLFETGKPLEYAVIKALKLIGYNAENFNDGKLELDQVIVSPEGFRYIGECEGKDNKDIDVSKFRQLIDSISEDFERDDISERANGIIFGNPQRLLQPDKRTLTFTQKCMNGAKREKIGLILTADLFDVVKYLLDNNDESFKTECRKSIHEGLGDIIKFPSPTK